MDLGHHSIGEHFNGIEFIGPGSDREVFHGVPCEDVRDCNWPIPWGGVSGGQWAQVGKGSPVADAEGFCLLGGGILAG